MANYEVSIGLEVHVQLNTASKAFCGDAVAFGAAANTLVSPISLGHPGTLPRINGAQIEAGVRLGLALGSAINRQNIFDRKNYFYSDLPKGYQITQDAQPICVGGALPLYQLAEPRTIAVHHLHLEEDAGKSIHDQDSSFTKVDLNRAGTPLLEIVTEPDLHSAQEVDAFMAGMRQLVRWLGISDGNMEEGSLRCDVNISLAVSGEPLGNRCEIKNMNSMRFAKRAIQHEIERQTAILKAGGTVTQETRKFHPETNTTSSLRSKEDAPDYRYFPDPDLPVIELSEELITEQASFAELLPWAVYGELVALGAQPKEAALLTKEKSTAEFAKRLLQQSKFPKRTLNLIVNRILPWTAENNAIIEAFPLDTTTIEAFITLIGNQQIAHSVAYQQLFPVLLENPKSAPRVLAQKLGLFAKDELDLSAIVQLCLTENTDKVAAYKKGKKGLLGFFMGNLMKRTQGKSNPKVLQKLLVKALES